MILVSALILFPLASAGLVLLLRPAIVMDRLVKFASLVICGLTLGLLVVNFSSTAVYFPVSLTFLDKFKLLVETFMAGYVAYLGLKNKKYLVAGLILSQYLLLCYLEFGAQHVSSVNDLFVDRFSLMMALIVGVLGSLICLYAIGYMRDFHRDYQVEVKDKRPVFFSLIFLFLSAMFGLIFCNNLLWIYFFWEITTFCSFLLIGYKGSTEAKANAFRALKVNLAGGLAFAAALVYLYVYRQTIELDQVMAMDKSLVLLPAVLIGFAGMTKSAQFPFSRWLLGAMVAPTPVSALLHSSTMVKAGVYILLRFSGIFEGTMAGFMLAIVGAVTFLIASLIAVTASDAKRVLAYSTIANLGLVVLCAGIGTYEAMWAAILLIIFHAVAKCLLFLCVGTIEHRIHSRNIEDMAGLIVTMPKLSIMMQVGMAGMFLAPFGMLISKWAVLKAIADYNPVLVVFVVFGGAATLFFWVKWLGCLIIVKEHLEDLEEEVSKSEWLPLSVLAVLTVGLCVFFPLVSKVLIERYVIEIYGRNITMSAGNVQIMTIMMGMVMLFPLSFINYGKRVKVVDAYLGAANADTSTQFKDSLGNIRDMQMHGYYLEKYFGEQRLFKFGVVICLALMVFMLVAAFIK